MHHIRYFLALSETLNMTKAAERCNVAQPALSRAIKARESRIDLAFAAGVKDQQVNTECARSSLHVSGLGFRRRIAGVDEEADDRGNRSKRPSAERCLIARLRPSR